MTQFSFTQFSFTHLSSLTTVGCPSPPSVAAPPPSAATLATVAKIWNECYNNEDELQSFRHKARQQDKVYEEREESSWILHLRTGIFYLKGHEGVMNEVPDGAAISASTDIGNVADIGKGKVPVPPFGSPERPRPDVTPRIAESFKSRPCHPELIRMYGYQSTDEYYADYDYWNTWVQDESTDEEDEDEVMTTKDDDLLFYQDTFPVDKFVPFGKAMGSKRIEKSPTIPVAVLGLCNTLTWVEIEKKLRKKPPMKH
ncbi:hypothetical protein Tco_0887620 [Tanacetum coccineum]